MSSYAFFIHRTKDPIVIKDVETVLVHYGEWAVNISYSLALTSKVQKKEIEGYPYLKFFNTEKNSKRVFAIVYRPPGESFYIFGEGSGYVSLPNFWTDDTAAVVNQQIRPLVLSNQTLVRDWQYGHHQLHDIAQDISVCLSILINADWIKEQDHWGSQFRLRQLLLGEDE